MIKIVGAIFIGVALSATTTFSYNPGICILGAKPIWKKDYLVAAFVAVANGYGESSEWATSDFARNYISRNPNCCKILPNRDASAQFSILSKFIGVRHVTARIVIPIRQRQNIKRREGIVEDVIMSRCGTPGSSFSTKFPIEKLKDMENAEL